ncbi:unnamed protein product [Prorocentrum cordatum]|uniref:Uncharacterized protein n=1 Tax=Prorocentrum cordatum TaxID=2364126 RepID=A0ABN9Q0U1_9DINO|nr:unnamed protein product [Polarella glacialis]
MFQVFAQNLSVGGHARPKSQGAAADRRDAAGPRRQAAAEEVREEGVLGLWTGAGPTASRATALAAAELSSYDEAKARLRALPVGSLQRDGIALDNPRCVRRPP